nr:MAG TPA: DNA packaging protein gp3 [Bacteriophage sp.]
MGMTPMYTSVEEIEGKIEQYFEDCKGYPLTDNEGNQIFNKFGLPVFIDVHPPTVTGLALALGFTSRQALLNYQAKLEFVDTITRAKARVEQYAEERLFDRDGSNGAQFSLRNNFKGWDADKKNDDSGDGKITIVNNIPRPEKQNERESD